MNSYNFYTNLSKVSSFDKYILLIVFIFTIGYLFLFGRSSILKVLIILAFSESIFGLLGLLPAYKLLYIFITLIYLYISPYNNYENSLKYSYLIPFSFLIFSVLYLFSMVINNVSIYTGFIDYSYYAIFFILLLKLSKSSLDSDHLKLIESLIFLQIIFSLIKLFLIGPNEALIGSISWSAGGVATVFPLLSLVHLYKFKFDKLTIVKKILWILGLLLIGIASNKRALWIIYPIILLILNLNTIQNRINLIRVFMASSIFIILIYLGLRINPSLNPQKIIWGEFNLGYAYKYITDYSYDIESLKTKGYALGRISGNINTMENLQNGKLSMILFGKGPGYFQNISIDSHLLNEIGYYSKKAITGASKLIITNGLLGFLFFFIFLFSSLNIEVKNKKIFRGILIIIFFDFFFYSGLGLINRACMLLYAVNLSKIK